MEVDDEVEHLRLSIFNPPVDNLGLRHGQTSASSLFSQKIGDVLNKHRDGTFERNANIAEDDGDNFPVLDSKLCGSCSKMTFATLSSASGYKHHKDKLTLVQAASLGCQICLWSLRCGGRLGINRLFNGEALGNTPTSLKEAWVSFLKLTTTLRYDAHTNVLHLKLESEDAAREYVMSLYVHESEF